MRVFNCVLSVAVLRTSYQVLPTHTNSLFTDLLHLSLGLPIFLCPWGFHCRVFFCMAPCSINFHLHFLISMWIGSWSVSFHRSSLDILSGHQIARIGHKHRLMKVWSGLVTVSVTFQVLLPYSKTDFIFWSFGKIFILPYGLLVFMSRLPFIMYFHIIPPYCHLPVSCRSLVY